MQHSKPIQLRGKPIDAASRCVHWHSPRDILAIQFACCGEWYPCYQCHIETADHPVKRWPKSSFATQEALACGNCWQTMTIHQYFQSGSCCPHCGANFNPGCQTHWHLYFEL